MNTPSNILSFKRRNFIKSHAYLPLTVLHNCKLSENIIPVMQSTISTISKSYRKQLYDHLRVIIALRMY